MSVSLQRFHRLRSLPDAGPKMAQHALPGSDGAIERSAAEANAREARNSGDIDRIGVVHPFDNASKVADPEGRDQAAEIHDVLGAGGTGCARGEQHDEKGGGNPAHQGNSFRPGRTEGGCASGHFGLSGTGPPESTSMPTKEEDFKQRFAAVLRDLQTGGKTDPEAIWLIGSLAAALIDKTNAPSWRGLKIAMTRGAYDELLRDFEQQGNALYKHGKHKHAYAVQALAISLIARTQRADPQMQAGDELLDEIIDHTVTIYRKSKGNEPGVN